MPAVTRTMKKLIEDRDLQLQDEFILNCKSYFTKINTSFDCENRIKHSLELYRMINQLLPKIIEKSLDTYIIFSAVTFNKATDLLIECNEGKWHDVNHLLIQEFCDEMLQFRSFITPVIRNYKKPTSNHDFEKAQMYFNSRNRRIEM